MIVQWFNVKPAHSGFGQYGVSTDSDCIGDDSDYLNNVDGELYELGVDDLPEGVEDIRGNIHDEPDRVFAVVGESREFDGWRELDVSYFGLSEIDEIAR